MIVQVSTILRNGVARGSSTPLDTMVAIEQIVSKPQLTLAESLRGMRVSVIDQLLKALSTSAAEIPSGVRPAVRTWLTAQRDKL